MRMIFGAIGGMKIGRGNRSTWRKPTPAPLCPPQNPTWQTRSLSQDRSGGKPATNRLSYGAAFFSTISSPLTARSVTVEVFDPASTRVIPHLTWTRRFGIVFIRAYHWFLWWARRIQSKKSHLLSITSVSILPRVGAVRVLWDGVWFGWLDLLHLIHSHSSALQAIQLYRWSTQFTIHRCTRTRVLSLH
jgi:hypothetical protein